MQAKENHDDIPRCPHCNFMLTLDHYREQGVRKPKVCLFCRNRVRVAYQEPVDTSRYAYSFEAVG